MVIIVSTTSDMFVWPCESRKRTCEAIQMSRKHVMLWGMAIPDELSSHKIDWCRLIYIIQKGRIHYFHIFSEPKVIILVSGESEDAMWRASDSLWDGVQYQSVRCVTSTCARRMATKPRIKKFKAQVEFHLQFHGYTLKQLWLVYQPELEMPCSSVWTPWRITVLQRWPIKFWRNPCAQRESSLMEKSGHTSIAAGAMLVPKMNDFYQ